MKEMKVFLNGKIVSGNEAAVSVFDRGFLFGEGLFETCFAEQGVVPFLDKHLDRMEWSASFIGLPFPHPTEIKQGVYELLKANQLEQARIKIILSATGDTQRPTLITDSNSLNLVILAEKISNTEIDTEGISACMIHSIYNDPAPASTVKSTSYLTKMMARREFLEKSCADGILLNAHKQVTETTSGNIFWFDGKHIVTPPVEAGLLPGITRQIIINLLKDEGLTVVEKLIDADQLKSSDEIFMTNSIMGVVPIIEIDEAPVGKGVTGPMTLKIISLYMKRLADEIEDELEERR